MLEIWKGKGGGKERGGYEGSNSGLTVILVQSRHVQSCHNKSLSSVQQNKLIEMVKWQRMNNLSLVMDGKKYIFIFVVFDMAELWTFHVDIHLCHITGGMLFSWGNSVKMGG